MTLAKPITCLVTPGEATDADFDASRSRMIGTVALAVEAGVSLIQIREKKLSARRLFELTCSVVAATRGTSTRVLVNDRADVAFAAEAHGVHLTFESVSATVIRDVFPREFVIGVSTHSVDEVVSAEQSGADFAVYGPVFETPGKRDVRGIEALREVCARVAPFPVLAIGGIDAGRNDEVMAAGASGIAAIRALNDADSIRRLLAKLK